MIISPGRGFIFVHIPKTGGTSLTLAFEERAMKDDILIGDTPKAQRRRRRLKGLTTRGRLWKHSRLADIDGLLSPEQIDAMTVVTLTRNPWDRMVSYYHWLRAQSFDHPAVARARDLEFGAFLRHPATRAEMAHDQIDDYLRMADGRVPKAMILRLETLERDLPMLEARLGCRLSLPRVNRSDRPASYAPFYDADTRAIVAEAYRDDIERMSYRFPEQ